MIQRIESYAYFSPSLPYCSSFFSASLWASYRGVAVISWLVQRLERVLNENVSIKEQLPLFRCMVEHQEGLDEEPSPSSSTA